MPYANEHACRLEDPAKFDKFNRQNCQQKHDGKCIDVIFGIKEGKSKIQALRYPKDIWDADDAKSHCKDRGGTFEAASESDSMEDIMEERGAIKSHKTGTSDKAWDEGANEKRLKLDQDAAFYGKFYAWRDPDGDESKKSSYKFGHHEVNSDGNPGPANIRGCQSGIGVLNGARGGTTIPSGDKKGVWNHLASHLKDADIEPAPLRENEPENIEKRVFSLEEFRVFDDGDEPPKIVGHPAVFNKLSEQMLGFREKVAPGAFKGALKNSDTRGLFNHDPNYVLGRESAETLKLKEDDEGLAMELFPPNTQLIKDMVLIPMKRKDIREGSFGFTVKKDQWEEDREKKTITRTIIEIDRLFDVSIVTFPAYPDTSVAVRSFEQWRDKNRSEPEPTGVIPEGWEDIKSADVDKALDDLHNLDIRLRKIEISKL